MRKINEKALKQVIAGGSQEVSALGGALTGAELGARYCPGVWLKAGCTVGGGLAGGAFGWWVGG